MDNELYHYGVLGMKWGVRRNRNNVSTGSKKKRSRTEEDLHDDYKKAHSQKSVKSMSDAELRSRLNRIQMEQNYKKVQGTDVSTGRKIAKNILKAGTTVAAVTGTALTIYNNIEQIKKIVGK